VAGKVRYRRAVLCPFFGGQLCCGNISLVNHAIFQSDRKHPLPKLHRLISARHLVRDNSARANPKSLAVP